MKKFRISARVDLQQEEEGKPRDKIVDIFGQTSPLSTLLLPLLMRGTKIK